MSEPIPGRPRTWVLWVVRAALALTVLHLGYAKISSIWTGQLTGSFWWLIMALPQVSIALIAVLICWRVDSRPPGLGLIAGTLNLFGMVSAVVFLRWLPIVIGVLAIIALVARPRDWPYTDPQPSRLAWLRR